METLHFFGVFDGHGGADAAIHCAKTLHERIREVFLTLASPTEIAGADKEANPADMAGSNGSGVIDASIEESSSEALEASCAVIEASTAAHDVPLTQHEDGSESSSFVLTVGDSGQVQGIGKDDDKSTSPHGAAAAATTTIMMTARLGVDMVIVEEEGEEETLPIAQSSSGDKEINDYDNTLQSHSLEGIPCTAETVEAALSKAFHLTDQEFGAMGGYEHLALVGTTAVVTLVGSRMIYVANCGDSRAVLCRDGHALPLTDDHKAAREDETARVEAAGGQVLFWNGVRVMGLLAVSRAIGDHSLRPYVIAEPEVTIVQRHTADELLVLASDGLWDVLTNQEACTLAKKCVLRARQRGSSRQSAARVAATVLARAAVDRGSRDNVTVVVVDLSSGDEESVPSNETLKQTFSTKERFTTGQEAGQEAGQSAGNDCGGSRHGAHGRGSGRLAEGTLSPPRERELSGSMGDVSYSRGSSIINHHRRDSSREIRFASNGDASTDENELKLDAAAAQSPFKSIAGSTVSMLQDDEEGIEFHGAVNKVKGGSSGGGGVVQPHMASPFDVGGPFAASQSTQAGPGSATGPGGNRDIVERPEMISPFDSKI